MICCGSNSWMVLFFSSNRTTSVGQKISVPPWQKYREKYAFLYRFKIYNDTYSELKNTKKHNRHLGVLLFIDILRRISRCRSPPIHLQKNGQEGVTRDERKKFKNIFWNFDNFRKTSSPRYERENQALFTTAFMQRGGDPLWSWVNRNKTLCGENSVSIAKCIWWSAGNGLLSSNGYGCASPWWRYQ